MIALNLKQVLEQEAADAAVLRRKGYAGDAERIEQMLARIRDAAEDLITFISEDKARLRSGHSTAWLRARYAQWAEQGHAYTHAGVRYYLTVLVPLRAHPSAAREAGREAGRNAARAARTTTRRTRA